MRYLHPETKTQAMNYLMCSSGVNDLSVLVDSAQHKFSTFDGKRPPYHEQIVCHSKGVMFSWIVLISN